MKLQCKQCGHEYEGAISKTENGWTGHCPQCRQHFPVQVPQGRIIMAFVDDRNPDYDGEHFTDNFTGVDILHYFAFDTPEAFMKAWEKMAERPVGMWYWVLDGDKCVCSGACDPNDGEESLKPYFGLE